MSKSRTAVQTQQMWAKIRATKRAANAARESGSKELGSAFVAAVDELTPRDTNRLSNGWLQAGNKAGVANRSLRPVHASKDQDKFLDKLNKQVDYWIKQIRYWELRQHQYEEADRLATLRKSGKQRKLRTSQPYYRKAVREEAKARANLKRALRELERASDHDGFIFFDQDATTQRKQNRSLSTVRHKVYGGDGTLTQIGTKQIVELINKEPHGNIVEANPNLGHPVATALEIVRAQGVRKVSKAYKTKLIAGSPLGVARSA